MKSLDAVLHDLYGKYKLLHVKEYKEKFEQMKYLFQMYGFKYSMKSDTEVFLYEVVYTSLLAKQRFEEMFFKVYTDMYDYWYDLTYQQRKHFMNIELERLKEELVYFMEGQQRIYFPCFSIFLNHLYTDELVLLDLKQYKKFIRNCANEVNLSLFDDRIYDHGFCSASLVARNQDMFVLYHDKVNRFYLYKQMKCVKEYSLDPKAERLSSKQLINFAFALLYEDEQALLHIMINEGILGKQGMKKVLKYQRKISKKVSE